MLLVDAINLGLHSGCLRLIRTESSPTSRPERNHSNRISSAGRLAKTSASAVSASLRGVTRRPPTWGESHPARKSHVAPPLGHGGGRARIREERAIQRPAD